MKICIRVDAAGPYGLGHISRMLPVACMLEELGRDDAEVAFVTTSGIPQEFVGDFDVIKLVETLPEEEVLNRIVAQQKPDVLVIDRKAYYDAEQLRTLRQACKIVRIDHAWAESETCDLLVLPNIHQSGQIIEQLDEHFGDALLYGAEYVVIREEVRKLGRRPYARRKPWIVFTTGGSDPAHLMPMLYDMTLNLSRALPSVRRIYCIGTYADAFLLKQPDSKALVTGYDPSYMQEASLVIGSFGVTAYEAMYLGTPMCTIGHNPVNAVGSGLLEKANEKATVDFTPHFNGMREAFCDAISRLWNKKEERRIMHDMSDIEHFDGYGAMKIADRILAL